ncbi:MAG: hypothetical protein GY818_11860, partial [Planctomycetaceae bacterium]|nr:hypothetical protein [Planctomycetaceae bacterium]
MSDGLDELEIVQSLGKDVIERLVNKTIRDLEEITTSLSGDSGLTNAWDEICVQCQGEESYYWEIYQMEIDRLASINVSKLKRYEIEAAWFLTEMADEWIDDRDSWRYEQWRSHFRNESECDDATAFYFDPDSGNSGSSPQDYETYPICEDEVTKLVKVGVYSEAANWSNERIRRYCDDLDAARWVDEQNPYKKMLE